MEREVFVSLSVLLPLHLNILLTVENEWLDKKRDVYSVVSMDPSFRT